MKKLLLLLAVLFSLFSCEENVKFNNPSFQGTKDNVFWRATQTTARVNSGGTLVMEAYTATEIVTLKTSSAAQGTYFIGTTPTSTASYVYTDPITKESITYSSGFGVGDGQIVITEYNQVDKTISGTFKFNLENTFNDPLAAPTLNFQNGVFYKIPVTIN
ncbi:DUF6252 family protein [Flavobacterium seoulense]|uniref:Lipocalin-like domain-containing protein n=1 Tax=Flavobacterium seoulense TaxID=1492738 RepID=A0A066WJJ2_9FLAO|nr:DUF6252 family protein [Flavobacterium seoulense]KDN54187.1 hypothetical protein FEM21_26530 [Flavobacterium seoulense]